MNRHSGSLLKDAGEMKGRCVHETSSGVESDPFGKPAGKICLDRLGAVRVIRIGTAAAAPAGLAVPCKRGLKHFDDDVSGLSESRALMIIVRILACHGMPGQVGILPIQHMIALVE